MFITVWTGFFICLVVVYSTEIIKSTCTTFSCIEQWFNCKISKMNHKQENYTSLSKLKQCTNAFNSQFSKIKNKQIFLFALKRLCNEFNYVSRDNLNIVIFWKYLKFIWLKSISSRKKMLKIKCMDDENLHNLPMNGGVRSTHFVSFIDLVLSMHYSKYSNWLQFMTSTWEYTYFFIVIWFFN